MTPQEHQSERERRAWELTPRPGWIASDHGPLLTWYHPPRTPARGPAVLLCDTLGSDRMNLHLAYRHLALRLAWAGFPALRIDYPGTGDSAGSPRDPHRPAAWLDAMDRGTELLKARSGATEVVAFGALFGATLATLLAARRADVTGVVAWGPYSRGREFLRQAKAVERMSGTNRDGRRPQDWQEGDMESLGFLFTAATVAELEALDLAALAGPGIRSACVMPWDEHQRTDEFCRILEGWGASVTRHPEPLSAAAACLQRQAVPDGVIAATVDWLAAQPAPALDAPVSCPEDQASVRIGTDPPLLETCVWMGSDRGVFGILTEAALPGQADPAAPAEPPLGVILVNGGNNHRAGINRNYTEWARRWAGPRTSVLRMDIRGLGDSPPKHARDLNVLYRRATADDVTAAMDWLAEHRGIRRFVLGGLCAGAFQALQAARHDRRVVGLWLLELVRFYHDERSLRARGARLLRRLTAGRLKALRRIPLLFDTPLARWFRSLCLDRGVRILALYRRDEPMLVEAFNEELSTARDALAASRTCELQLIDGTNHIFSPLWNQALLTSVLDAQLGKHVENGSACGQGGSGDAAEGAAR